MNRLKDQGLPREVQENIIHNIQQIFPAISRDVIKNILSKEEWDLERSLRFLHATLKSYNNAKDCKNQRNISKADKPSKPRGNNSKPQNKPDLFQKRPNSKPGKPKPEKIAPGDWVVVNKPSPVPNAPKFSKKTKKIVTQKAPKMSKEELIMKVQDENNANTTSSSMSKQARRTLLIQNFGIIKHFGDPAVRVSAYIKEDIKIMVLLRGCSGSGKSTYAHQILMKSGAKHPKNHIFSSDNFFIRGDGRYYFNADLLQEAHEWNQKLVRLAAAEGRSPIFIDNTNSRLWEMKEYAVIAVQYGYVLETLEPPTPWFFNEDILVRKTSHSTPRETIRKMLDRYEANLTGEDVIKNLQLSYIPPMIPPQGAMAGIKSPISKKHFKMLNIPLNIPIALNSSNRNSWTLKPESGKAPDVDYQYAPRFKKDPNKFDMYSFGMPSKFAPQEIRSLSDLPCTVINSSGTTNVPGIRQMTGICTNNSYEAPIQGAGLQNQAFQDTSDHLNSAVSYKVLDNDPNSKESSSDFIDSDSEEINSSSSSSSSSSSDDDDDDDDDNDDDCQEESDVQDSNICPEKDEILEYVLVSEQNQVIFQREHEELKDIKTLEDFKKSVATSKIFPEDFENYLLKYMESSGIKQESGKFDEITNETTKPPLNTPIPSNIGASIDYTQGFQTPSLYPKLPLYTDMSFECSTNTDPRDFEILEKAVAGEIKPGIQIFEGRPYFESLSTNKPIPLKPFQTSEQSTMTYLETSLDQELEGAVGGINPIDTLHSLFPKVPKEKLVELFGTSLDDIDWAIGLLLDSGQEMVDPPKGNSGSQPEGVNVGSIKDVIPIKESPNYIGDWDYKRELPKELPKELTNELPKRQRELRSQFLNLHGVDIATNTNCVDFEVLREINNGISYETSKFKIRVANRFFISGLGISKPVSSSVLMLEKGTMTSDFGTNRLKEFDSGIERLAAMFPRVSRENLEELFEKCQKDIDWAAGLLLDSGQEMSELFTSLGSAEVSESEDTKIESLRDSSIVEPKESSTSKPKKKKKLRISKSDNELYKEIQEKIQNNFVLDESHYSSERMKNYFQRKNKNNINDDEKVQALAIPENNEDISCEIVEQEDDIMFMMDSDFILQLQARFGGLLRPNMIGDRTPVSLPLSLARQLHCYVMDSVHKNIEEEDVFTDEDEEYARHLQEEEMRSKGAPSLLAIMDEEVALRKTHKELGNGNGRSMASTLSKQLLIERFPKMDPSTLANILEDTNHSLHQASCLLASAGHEPADVEDQTPQSTPTKSKSTEKCTLSREEAIKQAKAYGDIASQLYEMRKDCLRKSQEAYRDGNHQVALYYSDMARWYMERIEKSNSLAAKAILTGYEGWTTLDLHFLQVNEAVNILDLFVDEVIRDLQESNKKSAEVFVITGRGLHSSGGRPVLKPVVKSKLTKRDLKCKEINPGMLSVIIPRTALTSYEYQQKTGS